MANQARPPVGDRKITMRPDRPSNSVSPIPAPP
jgi:hypothetical protein